MDSYNHRPRGLTEKFFKAPESMASLPMGLAGKIFGVPSVEPVEKFALQIFMPGGINLCDEYPLEQGIDTLRDTIYDLVKEEVGKLSMEPVGQYRLYTISNLDDYRGSRVLGGFTSADALNGQVDANQAERGTLRNDPLVQHCLSRNVSPTLVLLSVSKIVDSFQGLDNSESTPSSKEMLSNRRMHEEIVELVGIDMSMIDDDEISRFRADVQEFVDSKKILLLEKVKSETHDPREQFGLQKALESDVPAALSRTMMQRMISWHEGYGNRTDHIFQERENMEAGSVAFERKATLKGRDSGVLHRVNDVRNEQRWLARGSDEKLSFLKLLASSTPTDFRVTIKATSGECVALTVQRDPELESAADIFDTAYTPHPEGRKLVTADQIIDAAVDNLKNQGHVTIDSHSPHVLQLRGFNEYAFGDVALVLFEPIRLLLKRREDIVLKLVPLSSFTNKRLSRNSNSIATSAENSNSDEAIVAEDSIYADPATFDEVFTRTLNKTFSAALRKIRTHRHRSSLGSAVSSDEYMLPAALVTPSAEESELSDDEAMKFTQRTNRSECLQADILLSKSQNKIGAREEGPSTARSRLATEQSDNGDKGSRKQTPPNFRRRSSLKEILQAMNVRSPSMEKISRFVHTPRARWSQQRKISSKLKRDRAAQLKLARLSKDEDKLMEDIDQSSRVPPSPSREVTTDVPIDVKWEDFVRKATANSLKGISRAAWDNGQSVACQVLESDDEEDNDDSGIDTSGSGGSVGITISRRSLGDNKRDEDHNNILKVENANQLKDNNVDPKSPITKESEFSDKDQCQGGHDLRATSSDRLSTVPVDSFGQKQWEEPIGSPRHGLAVQKNSSPVGKSEGVHTSIAFPPLAMGAITSSFDATKATSIAHEEPFSARSRMTRTWTIGTVDENSEPVKVRAGSDGTITSPRDFQFRLETKSEGALDDSHVSLKTVSLRFESPKDEAKELQDYKHLLDSDICWTDRCLRLSIVGVESLYALDTKSDLRFCEFMSKRSLTRASMIAITGEIWFGDEMLCPVESTRRVPIVASPRWQEWLDFKVSMCNLPCQARLCLTLWAFSGPDTSGTRSSTIERKKPLAHVNVSLVDHLGYFRAGHIVSSMFRDEAAYHLNTCTQNHTETATSPKLHVEFETFHRPMRFLRSQEQLILGRRLEFEQRSETKGVDGADPPSLNQIRARQKERASKEVAVGSILERVGRDPLSRISTHDKALVWSFRHEDWFRKSRHSLSTFLRSVQWSSRPMVAQAYVCISEWPHPTPFEALELLSVKFADPEVRRLAVQHLYVVTDSELMLLLPQLCQVLKSELFLDSPLARFLLARSLENPWKVGHDYFWLLKAEIGAAARYVSIQRFSVYLAELLTGMSQQMRTYLLDEARVESALSKLSSAAKLIKGRNAVSRKRKFLHEMLPTIHLPSSFFLPVGTKFAADALKLESCKVMDSKQAPLWLTFQNVDRDASPLRIIYKTGDDLRQDVIVIQLMRIMEKLWESYGLDLKLNAYQVVSTGTRRGVIEVVEDSVTFASITMAAGGARAVFKNNRVDDWLRKNNPGELYGDAVDNFVRSVAGYCVATYVLGVGDRHDSNIMLQRNGSLFHIDFGHFLGNFKDFKRIPGVTIRRETSPLVFSPAWAHALKANGKFELCQELCCQAFEILRKHSALFINMLSMMLNTGIPELKTESDVRYVVNALFLDCNEDEARKRLKDLIRQAIENRRKKLDSMVHIHKVRWRRAPTPVDPTDFDNLINVARDILRLVSIHHF